MIFSYASNAVLSKARAMYGKRISDKNYDELLSCRNVPDIAGYLKRKTNYSDVLVNINENNVHRAELESSLRLKLFVDFELLARYDISVGEHFYEYLISRVEIELFMHSLIFMMANKTSNFRFIVPEFFYEHTKINLKDLSNIKSYDDFLKIIKKSRYYEILKKFRPEDNKVSNLNITGIETALYNYSHKIVFKIIDKYVSNGYKNKLKSFFNLYIDLSNLIRIVRMKKYYKLSSEYMNNVLLEGGELSREKLGMFIDSGSNKEMMENMKSTRIGKRWFSKNLDIIDKVPINMRYNWCKHNIRFSVCPSIVLISYIFLKEIETFNIINIIEGVKYNLSPDEIKKMLIK